MGRGTSNGLSVRDYYKKLGQKTHGQGAKRRKLSHQSELRRKEYKAAQKRTNPANG